MRKLTMALGLVVALSAGAAMAEAADTAADGCKSDAAQPATAPAPGNTGTAPGNAGNTGWTGGTGGSQIGTSGQGAVPESQSWQPPTATGLDLAGTSAKADC